jgi:hypothetical protein
MVIKGGRRVGLTTLPPSMSRLSTKCGNLNIPQPCGPTWPVTGIPLLTKENYRTPQPVWLVPRKRNLQNINVDQSVRLKQSYSEYVVLYSLQTVLWYREACWKSTDVSKEHVTGNKQSLQAQRATYSDVSFFLVLFFGHEVGGDAFLRNFDWLSVDHTF